MARFVQTDPGRRRDLDAAQPDTIDDDAVAAAYGELVAGARCTRDVDFDDIPGLDVVRL